MGDGGVEKGWEKVDKVTRVKTRDRYITGGGKKVYIDGADGRRRECGGTGAPSSGCV